MYLNLIDNEEMKSGETFTSTVLTLFGYLSAAGNVWGFRKVEIFNALFNNMLMNERMSHTLIKRGET